MSIVGTDQQFYDIVSAVNVKMDMSLVLIPHLTLATSM